MNLYANLHLCIPIALNLADCITFILLMFKYQLSFFNLLPDKTEEYVATK